MKHHCDELAMSIQITYKKRTTQNKFASDVKFHIDIKNDFPNSPPEVFCISNFIYPTLFDNRNLINSILSEEWKPTNSIEQIIDLIPALCERVLENNTNKYLCYYGEYKIDQVYDINHFLCNSELSFFKCLQFLKCKSANKAEKMRKERYIILSDVYFLLFDPAPNFKNMAKLLFWGDIRYLRITKTDNYHEEEKAHSYILEWLNDNSKIISFEILFANSFINNNFVMNPIQDFIDAVDKKSNKLKDNFRVFHEDYFKSSELLTNANLSFDNLNSLIKYNENKFSVYKNAYLAKSLVLLYKKVYAYYKKFNDSNANAYEIKIQNLNNKDFEHKVIDNYEIKYDIKNNYKLSRSYSNTYHEDFV